MEARQARLAVLLFAGSTLLLALGGVLWLVDRRAAADVVWLVGT